MTKKCLTKKELEKLIEAGDQSVKLMKKKINSNSSELWQYYHHIVVNDHQQEFVVCNTYKAVLVYTSTNGTNNLRTHLKSCRKTDKSSVAYQQTVHDFYSSSKQLQIPKKMKLSITQACIEFCALDSRAFKVIHGRGFQNLAKSLIDIGRYVHKSSIKIKDLLPHPTTISRNITRIYEESKIQLINICKNLSNFCIVVDQWTEHYAGISYCGIALRYVNDNFQLFTFVMGCLPYDAPSHSAQHLREFVNQMLQEDQLQLDSTKYVVSDNETKMVAAFRDQCTRIGCADHYLNKQLQHAFESEQIHINKNRIEKVNCELAQYLFGQIKKVVSSVRRSHQQQKLSKKLQSYSETRFAGGIIMLDIFREVFFRIINSII